MWVQFNQNGTNSEEKGCLDVFKGESMMLVSQRRVADKWWVQRGHMFLSRRSGPAQDAKDLEPQSVMSSRHNKITCSCSVFKRPETTQRWALECQHRDQKDRQGPTLFKHLNIQQTDLVRIDAGSGTLSQWSQWRTGCNMIKCPHHESIATAEFNTRLVAAVGKSRQWSEEHYYNESFKDYAPYHKNQKKLRAQQIRDCPDPRICQS